MRELVIEYVLGGRQQGYTFTSPTTGFNDDTLKTVWRQAMPRGQGWGKTEYQGAHSLKSFALLDGRVALSDVTVTDQADEGGRRGIRRAVVTILQPGEYLEHLRRHFSAYPLEIQMETAPRAGPWSLRRRIPHVRGDSQLVLAHPYTGPAGWQRVEASVLAVACDLLDRRWRSGRVIPFTTLALDFRDESQLVAIPQQVIRFLNGVNAVNL